MTHNKKRIAGIDRTIRHLKKKRKILVNEEKREKRLKVHGTNF